MNLDKATQVTVIVLAWNRAKETEQCLLSLCNQSVAAELVLVDNGSEPHESVKLRAIAQQTGAKLIRNETNLGYAGGMNAGLPHVGTKLVVLSNNDVIYDDKNAIRTTIGQFNDPETGIAQPIVLDWVGKPVDREYGWFPTLGNLSRRSNPLQRVLKTRTRRRDEANVLEEDHLGVWIGLPTPMLRTQELRDWGGVVAPAKFYGEDLLLCWSATSRGLAVRRVGNAHVTHGDDTSARDRWTDHKRVEMKARAWAASARIIAPNRLNAALASILIIARAALAFASQPSIERWHFLKGVVWLQK